MELSYIVVFKWFFFNLVMCLLQFLTQDEERIRGRIPPRHSIIKGTDQKFLYWEDFSTQTWGDIAGLGLVWVAFGHVWKCLAPTNWILAFGTALLGSFGFWLSCVRPQHKPDWGYPSAGKISLGGLVHLVYFGASLAVATIGIGVTIYGILQGIPLLLFIVGSTIWIAAAIDDFVKGRFDPRKPY